MDKYVFWDEHLKLFSLLAEIAFQWSRVFHETKYIMGVHQFPNNCVFVMKVESTRNHDIFHWTVPIYAYILLVTTTYTLRLFIRRSESNRFPIISKRFTSYDYKNIYAQLTFITRTHIPRQGKLPRLHRSWNFTIKNLNNIHKKWQTGFVSNHTRAQFDSLNAIQCIESIFTNAMYICQLVYHLYCVSSVSFRLSYVPLR